MKKLFKKIILILPGYDDNQKLFHIGRTRDNDNDLVNFKNLEIFKNLIAKNLS